MAKLNRQYGLTDREAALLRNSLNGPTGEGAPLWAVMRHKHGECRHALHLTIGSTELWALTTTPDDVALRNRLCRQVGARNARNLLGKCFPQGTARAAIESRLASEETNEASPEASRNSAIDRLVREILDRHSSI